jgi:hypothetical protein
VGDLCQQAVFGGGVKPETKGTLTVGTLLSDQEIKTMTSEKLQAGLNALSEKQSLAEQPHSKRTRRSMD